MYRKLLAFVLFITALTASAQEDLFDLFEDSEKPTELVYATFKGTRLINGQTLETPGGGVAQYIISHRFGSFSDRYFYNFMGLDNAQIRMQMDYGITDRLNIGAGRSSVLKVSDAFIKYRLLRQKTGANSFPFSLTLNSSVNYRGADYTDGFNHHNSDRLSYSNLAILGRKFNQKLSLQAAIGAVHWNLVPSPQDQNTIGVISFGGRYKLTNRMALTSEYSISTNTGVSNETLHFNPISVGIDVETGGHVFQFHLGNVRSMSDPYWLTRNPYNPTAGQLYLGFNISRVFTIRD